MKIVSRATQRVLGLKTSVVVYANVKGRTVEINS